MPPQPLSNDKQSGKSRVRAEEAVPRMDDKRRMAASTSSGKVRETNPRHSRQPLDLHNESDSERMHAQSRQRRQLSRQQQGSSAAGGGQYAGVMPMGGYGMGMGMPFGYGMGYGGMMGGGGFMAGPMSMMYSINYFIAMMGQLTTMLGISAQAIGPLYQMARESLIQLEKSVRQSEVRRWLQRKSAQSPLLRSLLVLASMLAASQVVRFIRYLLELRMRKSNLAITAGGASAVSSSIGDTLTSAATSILPDQGV